MPGPRLPRGRPLGPKISQQGLPTPFLHSRCICAGDPPQGCTPTPEPDYDSDGKPDTCDNCPFVANADQADSDTDEVGNVCDNCPQDANPDQEDADLDTVGDACDNCPLNSNSNQLDGDSDEVGDDCDNCPQHANPDQENLDGDNEGDACDSDDDNDNVVDTTDNCPRVHNASQSDRDGDGWGDVCDNCPDISNSDQLDTNDDGIGDVCDNDYDDDDIPDDQDNCPLVANTDQADGDSDGVGYACDNCLGDWNPGQEDRDNDGIGDACDTCTDVDDDEVCDDVDNCPFEPNTDQTDTDQDDVGDACELDELVDLEYIYDELNRVAEVKRNGASLMTYVYQGRQVSRRTVLSEYRARAQVTTSRDVYIDCRMEYDSHRRMTKIRNSARYTSDPANQGSSLAQYEHTYDEAGNRLTHIASQFARPRQVGYVYDDLSRLSKAEYLIGSGTPTQATTTYAYDLLGNRNEVLDGLNKKTWTYGANSPANEYAATTVAITKPDLTVETHAQTVLYDRRGNLTADEGFEPVDGDQFVYEYDIENRLTKVTYDDGVAPVADVADYRYDAIGRRIEYVDHIRYNPTTQAPGVTIRYFHDGQNVVEEYDGNDIQPLRQRGYINGAQYIDERVVMRLYDVEAHDHYYIHQELYTVTGLVARNGLFEEAYQYDAYGQATVYQWPFGDVNWDGQTASGDITIVKARSGQANPDPWADLNMDGQVASGDITLVKAHSGETLDEINYSSLDNPFFFTGRLTDTLHASAYEIDTPWICWDPEDPECEDPVEGVDYDALARRLQDNRNRTYDPRHGRWLQRDPIGLWPSREGLIQARLQFRDGPNLVSYVQSSPTNLLDWNGLASCGPWKVVEKPWKSYKLWLSHGYVTTGEGSKTLTRYVEEEVDFQVLQAKVLTVDIIGKTTKGEWDQGSFFFGVTSVNWVVPKPAQIYDWSLDEQGKRIDLAGRNVLCRKLQRCARKCYRCCNSGWLWNKLIGPMTWSEHRCMFSGDEAADNEDADGIIGYAKWWYGKVAGDDLTPMQRCELYPPSSFISALTGMSPKPLILMQPSSEVKCDNIPSGDDDFIFVDSCSPFDKDGDGIKDD